MHHGADDGNRTHITSLEGWGSTIELHPLKSYDPVLYESLTFSFLLCQQFWDSLKGIVAGKD